MLLRRAAARGRAGGSGLLVLVFIQALRVLTLVVRRGDGLLLRPPNAGSLVPSSFTTSSSSSSTSPSSFPAALRRRAASAAAGSGNLGIPRAATMTMLAASRSSSGGDNDSASAAAAAAAAAAAFKAKRGKRGKRSSPATSRGSLNSSNNSGLGGGGGVGGGKGGGRMASMHLPAEQQMTLARCVRAWEDSKAAKAEAEAALGRPLSFEEWAGHLGVSESVLRRRIDDGRQARELLIMTNINLVKSMALKYTARQEKNENRLSMDDLVLEGTQGLLKSMSKFDPAHGVKFTTYAVWWIRQAMSLAIQTHSNTVRLPILLQARIKKVRDARARLYLALEREPSAEELGAAVGLPADKVAQIRRTSVVRRSRSFMSEEDSLISDLAMELHALPDVDLELPALALSSAAVEAEADADAVTAAAAAASSPLPMTTPVGGGGRTRESLLQRLKTSDRQALESRWEQQVRERTVLAVTGRRMKRIREELTQILREKDYEDRRVVFDSMLCAA